jgi:hypothetical protein
MTIAVNSVVLSGSAWIRNILQDLNPILEFMDPAPDPQLDLNIIKNHPKINSYLVIMTLKYILLTFALKKYLQKKAWKGF